MRTLTVLVLAAATCLSAQVRFTAEEIVVRIDDKPFTTFHYGTAAHKPFLAPLYSASGKIVTRGFPMEMIDGESRDHLHHRGLWLTYDDINGVKFWENDPSYTKPRMGTIIVRETSWKDGQDSGTLTADMDWLAPEGDVLLKEHRDMVFRSGTKLRIIDFDITLTAAQDVTIGDTKEGAFAIRLAENFTSRQGGKIADANGRKGMLEVWGKRSKWVDYSGVVDGEQLGVAIFDNPSNPNFPAYWHARDYGLFSLNPFGQRAFDPDADERQTKLTTGQHVKLQFRVVIHPGDAETGHVAELYEDYVAGK